MSGSVDTVSVIAAHNGKLATRSRGLMAGLILPMFVVVLGLAFAQYRSQRASVLNDFTEIAKSNSVLVDAVAKQFVDHALRMRSWAEGFLRSPLHYEGELRSYLKQRLTSDRAPDGYTLDSLPPRLRDKGGIVLWMGSDPSKPPAGQEGLDFALEFLSLARLTHDVSPLFQWSYYFPADRSAVSTYPWRPSSQLVEQQGFKTMRAAVATYYDYEIFTAATPAKNPSKKTYWTEPYIDAFGAGAMVSQGSPYYIDDQFAGVVGTDLRLDTLQQELNKLRRPFGRLLIVDKGGFVLADTRGMPHNAMPKLADIQVAGLTLDAITRAKSASEHVQRLPGGELVAHELVNANWSVVGVVTDGELVDYLLPRFIPYGVILVALSLVMSVVVFLIRREFIRPSLDLVNFIFKLARREPAQLPSLPSLWRSSAAAVADTFEARRRADFQLMASDAFKTALVKNGLLPVITMDEGGRIAEFNGAAERVFGHVAHDVIGADMAELIIPEAMRGRHRAGVQRYLDTGEATVLGKRLEIVALHKTGRELPMELTIFATVVDEQNFFTAFLVDMTERVQNAAELAKQREMMRENEKLAAMGGLLAGVAHELNNPLAILIGRTTLLQETNEDAHLTQDLQRIRTAAERCARIVRTFLAMARRRPAEYKGGDLNETIHGAIDLMGYKLRSGGIDIQLRLAPNLPLVQMDSDQIGQVILNLVVNAEQSLSASQTEGSKTIVVESKLDGASVCVSVVDNGAGVPPNMRQRIFDPFVTSKSDGVGIGLAVCNSIAIEHGGDLHLEDTQTGASFLLRLPIAGKFAAVEKSVVEQPYLLTGKPAGRVLVVDDEPELVAVMGDILRSAGYSVATANSGAQALQWLDHNRCDIIFSDIRMPDMSGPELWRELQLRKLSLALRMGFITGDTLSASITPFLLETGLPCLEKPFNRDELLQFALGVQGLHKAEGS